MVCLLRMQLPHPRSSTQYWKIDGSSFDLVHDAKSKGSKYLDFGIAHTCASSSCLRGVLVYSLEFRVCIDDHLWRCPLSFRIGAIIRTSRYAILLYLEYGLRTPYAINAYVKMKMQLLNHPHSKLKDFKE
jgi:hypothetical protein